ncbi:2-succinyl-5-enolpyruvyl-6-hydroxy-3-cyclohexene-1-carboxylic-acid synthase [Haematomicrobium sanguinis]|uniref:2-succinyl-5-enolpyruvyl-6-hydroxy-3- cyclohexene-1-carboxylic-acid synthase n=1 Tax=Haematomicrobium sanguinis TaxID=479106 RepID=UPI00047E32C1|nr:2-succinyl-5-enolpyruvyl-6-hydroxy-3-cyclohexene-1-carboxylic-acid synthase [Haematomicrobium sanguinis]
MRTPATSLQTANALINGLIDNGVRDFVIAPGSRSAPLAYVVAAAERAGHARIHVRIDERDAAYLALGLSKAGALAAVITTSGTAVGNLLPAVMEASHSSVPLVILTADRPEDMHGTGANQTTFQQRIFGRFVRQNYDVPVGTQPRIAVVYSQDAAWVARGIKAPTDNARVPPEMWVRPPEMLDAMPIVAAPGPVHVNVQFAPPLVPDAEWTYQPPVEPSEVDPNTVPRTTPGGIPIAQNLMLELVQFSPMLVKGLPGTPERARWEQVQAAKAEAAEAAKVPHLADAGYAAVDKSRTVVIAGDGAGGVAEDFARTQGLPLLAEPSSNARFGPNAIEPYRLLIPSFAERIERVVVFGHPTLSRPVASLMDGTRPLALYAGTPVAWFEGQRAPGPVTDSLAELAEFAGAGPEGWLAAWQRAGSVVAESIRRILADEPSLPSLSAAEMVWNASGANLVVGSSNVVRDLDLMASAAHRPLDVFANRGLAGIDGTVSTGLGVAAADGIPTRLYVGDVTALHDVGGLLRGAFEGDVPLQIVVLNDLGGAIFGVLEHGEVGAREGMADAVERLFATPHNVDFAHLGAAYGVPHTAVSTTAELATALAAPIRGVTIVEVAVDRGGLRELHDRIREAASRAG